MGDIQNGDSSIVRSRTTGVDMIRITTAFFGEEGRLREVNPQRNKDLKLNSAFSKMLLLYSPQTHVTVTQL